MNSPLNISIQKLAHAEDLPLPSYHSELAAGLDLIAGNFETILIPRGQTKLIPTGIAIALPAGFEAQIRPRSGLAAKHGVTVLNSPGTIDADYRGEIRVLLINHGDADFVVERGMRIAQIVIAPITRIQWQEVSSLEETTRGSGGFGHTGI